MGHNHTSAAVALQAKLVHSITKQSHISKLVPLCIFPAFCGLPVGLSWVGNQLEVALPKVAGDLR